MLKNFYQFINESENPRMADFLSKGYQDISSEFNTPTGKVDLLDSDYVINGSNKTIKVYHISQTPITKMDNRYLSKQTPRDKPEGLWFTYAPSTWKDFYIHNDGNHFTYEIILNTSNLIKLDSVEKIKQFNEKYESDKSIFKQDDDMIQEMYGMIWVSPNWIKVKKDYDGIEFPNFVELKNEIDFDDVENRWLTFIDVNSGCVWNENSIVDFKKI